MINTSVIVSLDDQTMSMKRFVWDIYGTGAKVEVEADKRLGEIKRPSWYIERVGHNIRQLSTLNFSDECAWKLFYYGSSRVDVDDALTLFNEGVQMDGTFYKGGIKGNRNLIPVWRHYWQFPQIYLTPYQTVPPEPTGTLSGTYSVRASGFDVCGNESAASVAQLVTVTTPNNAFKVRAPKVPGTYPVFKEVWIYVAEKKEVVILQKDAKHYAEAKIGSLLGTGAAPKNPGEQVAVRWKFMRVTGMDTRIAQDRLKDGSFMGIVTLSTTCFQERQRSQEDVMREITTREYINIDTVPLLTVVKEK
jgi:hypothetical protein